METARPEITAMISKYTAVFLKPFMAGGMKDALPGGAYEVEAELEAPPGHSSPQEWKASVVIHLHPVAESPGLVRTLTIPLAELEFALAQDKLSDQLVAGGLLDRMLADPMVRLIMRSDGVSEAFTRRLFSRCRMPALPAGARGRSLHGCRTPPRPADRSAVEAAENEGMPARN